MPALERKRVLVTGAAGGIGSLVASRLRLAGAHVIGIDRVEPTECHEFFVTDLASETSLIALAEHLAGLECDILVNLAGVQYFGPFAHQNPVALWRDYAVNLIAPSLLVRAVLPGMIARDRGQIVNIGSVFGAIPFGHFASYSSAKAGLRALSQALRRELAGTGIIVTHVAPRAVKTALCSDKVLQFAAATGMHMDEPHIVAARIVDAIVSGARDIVIGFPESLFVRINAIAPRLVDRALAANDRKAAALFR